MGHTSRRSWMFGSALAAGGLLAWPRWSIAEAELHDGPLLLTILASGAWDPSFFTDPTGEFEHNRLTTEVAVAHGIRYSPIELAEPMGGMTQSELDTLMSNQGFFEKHGGRMVAINGVKFDTIAHAQGRVQALTGRTTPDYPSLAALMAAAWAPKAPLAFMSYGGDDPTMGVVPLTRFRKPVDLEELAAPHLSAKGNEYAPVQVRTLVDDAVTERSTERAAQASWPHRRRAAAKQLHARDSLRTLEGYTPPATDDLTGLLIEPEAAAIRTMMSCFSEGYCAAGHVTVEGFDSHSDHDLQAPAALARLWAIVDQALSDAATFGVAEKLTIVVTSDFARPRTYSATDGKDHLPTGAYLVLRNSFAQLGSRHIGAMDGEGKPLPIDPVTLELTDAGKVMGAAHVHRKLRELLGMSNHEVCASHFPLDVSDFGLFGV